MKTETSTYMITENIVVPLKVISKGKINADRRKKIRWFLLMALLLIISSCSNKIGYDRNLEQLKSMKKPIRGVWLVTIKNLDWPPPTALRKKKPAERIRIQKQALSDALDDMVKTGINTVFFQVKPDGTALWNSDMLPWSDILTGTIGENPGYDPLAFILEEAHRRGIRVHAWLNPYRVSMDTKEKTISALNHTLQSLPPASVYVLHPDWIRTANNSFVLDPGLPKVRNWLTSLVTEIVKRYDVDGIQFDDYFYNETPKFPLNDISTYRKYGKEFANKENWRRNNTLLLIKQVSSAVKALRPNIEFGISPSGIWRNKIDDPEGSDTRGGAPSYDAAYADILLWIKQGLLDYVVPQIYWPFEHKIASYNVLVKWWAKVVKNTQSKLYIGIAFYKIGKSSTTELEWSLEGGVPELKRQLDLIDSLLEVKGVVLFRQSYLKQIQTEKAVKYLRVRWKTEQY